MNGYSAQDQALLVNRSPFRCHPNGIDYLAQWDGKMLLLQQAATDKPSQWQLQLQQKRLQLEWGGLCCRGPELPELLAALEATFAYYPEQHSVDLSVPLPWNEELLRSGIVLRSGGTRLTAYADLFWQQPRIWLTPPQPELFPLHYVLSHGRRHPLRSPKPSGVVYRRHIPWLGCTLSFRAVNSGQDLERFNRWMNDPVVAQFWQAEGDLATHGAYLENVAADPHVINLIGCFDNEPFGYWEVYWAKEDRLAPFYDADDFDRGWHVLIGEARFRGKPFVTAWLPSISHYLFLDDCRTQRLVIEPRSDNYKMIRNLALCGYATLKEFDFPHKRATLGMLLRERFFSERCWVPRGMSSPCSIESLS